MKEFTEQELVRRNKLEEISKVCNPYPEKFERTHTLKNAATLEAVSNFIKNVCVAATRLFRIL